MMNLYSNIAKKYPKLTRNAEQELIEKTRNDLERRRELLILHHVSLAIAVAKHYKTRIESFDDGIQLAMIGLIKAAEAFDPSRGNRFMTYALPKMLREVRYHSQIVDGMMDLVSMSLDNKIGYSEDEERTLLDYVGRLKSSQCAWSNYDETSSFVDNFEKKDTATYIYGILDSLKDVTDRDKDIFRLCMSSEIPTEDGMSAVSYALVARVIGSTRFKVINIVRRIARKIRMRLLNSHDMEYEIQSRIDELEMKRAKADGMVLPEKLATGIENEIEADEDELSELISVRDDKTRQDKNARDRVRFLRYQATWREKLAKSRQEELENDGHEEKSTISNTMFFENRFVSRNTMNYDRFVEIVSGKKPSNSISQTLITEFRPEYGGFYSNATARQFSGERIRETIKLYGGETRLHRLAAYVDLDRKSKEFENEMLAKVEALKTEPNIKKQICMGREIELEAESSRMEDQTIRDIDPSFVDLDMDNDDGSSDYEID
jgi:RNA polymerase sigma factor (sigma-70 family)